MRVTLTLGASRKSVWVNQSFAWMSSSFVGASAITEASLTSSRRPRIPITSSRVSLLMAESPNRTIPDFPAASRNDAAGDAHSSLARRGLVRLAWRSALDDDRAALELLEPQAGRRHRRTRDPVLVDGEHERQGRGDIRARGLAGPVHLCRREGAAGSTPRHLVSIDLGGAAVAIRVDRDRMRTRRQALEKRGEPQALPGVGRANGSDRGTNSHGCDEGDADARLIRGGPAGEDKGGQQNGRARAFRCRHPHEYPPVAFPSLARQSP